MKEILIATRNKGKINDFKYLLEPRGIKVKSLLDFEEVIDVVEDKDTFVGNATKKAEEISTRFNIPVIADDSGLEIEALNGRPGVYTARYAKKDDSLANMNKVIDELNDLGLDESPAQFVCCLAIATPRGEVYTGQEICKGTVIKEMRGEKGFGYDQIFYMPELGKTFAELTIEEKNRVSHRFKAINSLMDFIDSQPRLKNMFN